jgi:hypothetical protein
MSGTGLEIELDLDLVLVWFRDDREEDLERDRGDGRGDPDRGERKLETLGDAKLEGDAILVRISRLELEDVRRTFSLLRRMSILSLEWLLRRCMVSIDRCGGYSENYSDVDDVFQFSVSKDTSSLSRLDEIDSSKISKFKRESQLNDSEPV